MTVQNKFMNTKVLVVAGIVVASLVFAGGGSAVGQTEDVGGQDSGSPQTSPPVDNAEQSSGADVAPQTSPPIGSNAHHTSPP